MTSRRADYLALGPQPPSELTLAPVGAADGGSGSRLARRSHARRTSGAGTIAGSAINHRMRRRATPRDRQENFADVG